MEDKPGDTVSPLRLTKSILDDACLHFASKKNIGVQTDKSVDVATPKDQSDPKNDNTELKLPPIEQPQRRRRQLGRMRGNETEKEWNVVERIDWRENIVDKRTIYNEDNDKLLATLEEDSRDILPPLDCSPRMSSIVPDSQDLLEKVLVIAHNLSMGSKAHYKKDKAVLPTVYSECFRSPERKTAYMNSLWEKYRGGKRGGQLACSTHRAGGSLRAFCDVMGSRYCALCQELNNRNFALTHEKSYLTDGRLSKALWVPPLGRRSRDRLPDPESLPRETKSLRNNTLLMPIKYLPPEGE